MKTIILYRRKKHFIVMAFLLLLFSQFQAYSQDSLLNKVQDSILQATSEQGKQMILHADSSIKADSLAQAELQKKIENLKGSEKRKKEALQLQLDSIEQGIAEKNERIKNQVDSIRSSTIGVPVVFHHDTLLFIYAKLGPFSPSERVNAIQGKIQIISKNFQTDRLKIIHSEESSDLFYDELIVLSVTDRDAFWEGKPRKELIDSYKSKIQESVLAYLDETSLYNLLIRIAMILLVIGVLIVMVRYLNKLFTRFVRYVTLKGESRLKGVKIKNYELLTNERLLKIIVFILNVFKWLLIIFITYSSLPIIFSVFPNTEPLANKLIGYVTSPVIYMFKSFIGYIPELITIAIIIVITRYFVIFLRFLSREIAEGKLVITGFYPDWAKPTFNLVSFIVHAFAFVIIFPYLPGSDSPVFQGVSVFLGLLISLGSSTAIGNIVAGLVITYMRPFKIGERVKIGETTGDVIEKTMLVTRLRTIKNEDITIPNSAILNGQTVNYTSSAQSLGLILNTSITIGYDVHWAKVRDSLLEAASMTEHIEKEPPPFVLQTSLDDFYVSYQINGYTKKPEIAAKIYSELHKNILEVFHNKGIEIMSPHFRAERDGSVTQMPEKE